MNSCFAAAVLIRTCVPLYLLVTAAGCAVLALMVLILDLCVFVVRRASFLRYDHGPVRTPVAAVLMPFAAGFVGMVGVALDVLQPSRSACIAVGIAWPTLMTVLMGVQEQAVKGASDEDDASDPGEELKP